MRLSVLESDVAVTKQVNKLLKNQITHLEKNCHASEQYSRRECLEISGVPTSVGNADVEKKVCQILDIINVHVSPTNGIEACHRISKSNNNVIVKFSRRKDCHASLIAKKKLNEENSKERLQNIGIQNDIYINQSLCPYYKNLRYKCKLLREAKHIHSFWEYAGKVFMKLEENGERLVITHEEDLAKHLPDVDLISVYQT